MHPKKYWWVVLILVPVVVAAIQKLPDLVNMFRPARETTAPPGTITIGSMVFVNNLNLIEQQYERTHGAPLGDPDLKVKIQRASTLAEQGSYREAIALLEELAPKVDVAAVANNLGVLQAKIGDVAKARKNFEHALEKNPNDEVSRRNAGIVKGLPINLLARENGGQVVVAPNDLWWMTIDGKEEGSGLVFRVGQWAVYAFRDERAATFDTFAVLIPASGNNVSEVEILAGSESPTGKFDSIQKCAFINAKVMKSPYQECKFPMVTAKYVKVQLLASYHFNNWIELYEFRLLGRLK